MFFVDVCALSYFQDFQKGLKELMDQPWGKKAVRIAIAMGEEADNDVLQKFIGSNEIHPLQANSPEKLVRYIKWVSTAMLKAASAPPSLAKGSGAGISVAIPVVAVMSPGAGAPNPADDVW